MTLGFMHILLLVGQGETLNWTKAFNSFWSVLVFYFVCLPSLYIWLRVISWKDHEIIKCLILSCCCFLLSVYIGNQLSDYKLYGLYEFIKLIFASNYNYFNMISGVFLGLAVGIYIYLNFDSKKLAKHMLITGLILSISGICLSIILGQQELWWIWPKPIYVWMWVFYYGVIMVMISGLRALTLNYEKLGSFFKKGINVGAVIGQLTLPIYVMHEIVIPMKKLLEISGLNGIVSFMLPLALFFTVIYLFSRKLYSIYYAS